MMTYRSESRTAAEENPLSSENGDRSQSSWRGLEHGSQRKKNDGNR